MAGRQYAGARTPDLDDERDKQARKFAFMDALSEAPDLGHLAVRISWRLLHHLNLKTGTTFCSQVDLAKECNASPRHVRRALAELRGTAWWTRVHRGSGTKGHADVYAPNCDKVPDTRAHSHEQDGNEVPDINDTSTGHGRPKVGARASAQPFSTFINPSCWGFEIHREELVGAYGSEYVNIKPRKKDEALLEDWAANGLTKSTWRAICHEVQTGKRCKGENPARWPAYFDKMVREVLAGRRQIEPVFTPAEQQEKADVLEQVKAELDAKYKARKRERASREAKGGAECQQGDGDAIKAVPVVSDTVPPPPLNLRTFPVLDGAGRAPVSNPVHAPVSNLEDAPDIAAAVGGAA